MQAKYEKQVKCIYSLFFLTFNESIHFGQNQLLRDIPSVQMIWLAEVLVSGSRCEGLVFCTFISKY